MILHASLGIDYNSDEGWIFVSCPSLHGKLFQHDMNDTLRPMSEVGLALPAIIRFLRFLLVQGTYHVFAPTWAGRACLTRSFTLLKASVTAAANSSKPLSNISASRVKEGVVSRVLRGPPQH